MPPLALTEEILPLLRQGFGARLRLEEDPEAVEKVTSERRMVPGRVGDPDVGIALHVPRKAGVSRGAILHLHGGGYVSGDAFTFIPGHRRLAMELDCVIVSVDYR